MAAGGSGVVAAVGSGAAAAVHTVGHGSRQIEEFLGVLRAASVSVLADVRRFPGSVKHPQFGRDALTSALGGAGIRYEWHGELLGGRRRGRPGSRHTALRNASFAGYADHMDSEGFRRAVAELVARSGAGERIAVMCAETLWWRCHRSFVADCLALRGVEVVHLVRAGEQRPHRLHSTLRRGEDGWPVYDVGDTLPGL